MNTENTKELEKLEDELRYWEEQFDFCYRMCRRAWKHNAFESHKKFVACLSKMGQITSKLRLQISHSQGFTLVVDGEVR